MRRLRWQFDRDDISTGSLTAEVAEYVTAHRLKERLGALMLVTSSFTAMLRRSTVWPGRRMLIFFGLWGSPNLIDELQSWSHRTIYYHPHWRLRHRTKLLLESVTRGTHSQS
jgi:hypothetical protein